ncbi:MAG TPA: hypothetical protein DG761_11070 [Gammaproteobacteria bacterium]|jgi:tetratricopeptide (TPR) repeat protein|nr:hypothetical protein [Acidiferrobacteraceae bacterium]HCX88554.1 hypothetical protein [Gammaproteobacteria bacterium]|tara:strand:+ start:1006 stop:2991 length:1986 start_codon:yes stop_codon:yes gene_type:complete
MTALHLVTTDGPAKEPGRRLIPALALCCAALVSGFAVIGGVPADESLKASSNLADAPAAEDLEAFSPALDLNFETLSITEGSLQPLAADSADQNRMAAPVFRLELGEETVAHLNRQNLDQLGLYLLQDIPAAPGISPAERQRQRWHLLERQGRFEVLKAELQVSLESEKGDRRLGLGLRLGDLLLRNGDPAQARAVFRRLLSEGLPNDGITQQLRQRIVLSYFDEGRFSDAAISAENLTLEFAPDQPSWHLLRALIALSRGRADKAVSVLREVVSIEASLWRVFARWQDQALSSSAALLALGQVKVPADNAEMAGARSAMIAQIADLAEHARVRALALEVLVLNDVQLTPLLQIDARAELLGTYGEIARIKMAHEGLTTEPSGAVWDFLLAEGSADHLGQRALGVTLLLQGEGPEAPASGDSWLIRHLIEVDAQGLIGVFIGDDGALAKFEDVGAEALMLLVDEALRREDLPLGARLQSLVHVPVPGIDPGAWTLRTARIHVLGGNADLGARQLGDWLSGLDEVAPASLDRVMQIMFDLQFIGEHQLALDLFQASARLVRTPGHRRELFYWAAQSWVGLGEYAMGAAYYLESARLSGEEEVYWQRSAFYQAAKALESAELYEDAGKVYRRLLGDSPESKMQAKLRYRLAQIERRRAREKSE